MELVCSALLVPISQMKEALNASNAHSKFHTPNQERSENPSVSTHVSLEMTLKLLFLLLCVFLNEASLRLGFS